MMNLDETQKATVREWIQSRTGLSEIQSKLDSEFGVSVTYMEVRFLVDDLGGLPAEPEPEPEETPEAVEGDSSVTVDQITRAGSMASGQVTFSDGKSAGWSLDQMGRLGLSSDEAGYKPSQEDVMEFQVQLQKKLSGPGL